jgi:hypothetical protein
VTTNNNTIQQNSKKTTTKKCSSGANMRTNGPSSVGALVACLLVAQVDADAFVGGPSVSFLSQSHSNLQTHRVLAAWPRGGAVAVEEEQDLDEIESSDEEYEEDEQEEKFDASLTKSAIQSAVKAKVKEVAAAKATVSSKLLSSAPTREKRSLTSMIPYIIRACFNPFTIWQMTRGYFKSLVNLDYPKVVRQEMR